MMTNPAPRIPSLTPTRVYAPALQAIAHHLDALSSQNCYSHVTPLTRLVTAVTSTNAYHHQ
ncbi:unnamed protein product, partial [Nesidiocoris tenuis]